MRSLKPVPHGAELPLVEHLDELRWRVVVTLAALGVALGLCLWQNQLLLDLLNHPLGGREPTTFGVTEPFSTTLTVAGYGAFVLTLPVALYQAYAFVLPALAPSKRRSIGPLLALVPLLFAAGVGFGYLIVLPAAVKFLLHFNDDQFQVLVRARDYYGFSGQTLLACGLLFQLPVAIIGATRLGLVTVRGLRRNRRYAIVAIAVAAMLLPGVDPVTMLLEMAPLIALYELSILLAALFGRPSSVPTPENAAA